MSFRQHIAFAGLYHEWQAGSTPKRYTFGQFDDTYSGGGTFTCTKKVVAFPEDFVFTVECPGYGTQAAIFEVDALDATYTDDITGADQTLAERSALLPTPDYVQIHVNLIDLYTRGGSAGVCLDPYDPVRCPPTIDADYRWVVDAVGEYPFGITETAIPSPTITFPDQVETTSGGGHSNAGPIPGTFLRRAPDGLTYEGQPDNLGVDTLFPYAELVANPTIRFGVENIPLDVGLHMLGMIGASITITPWYRLDQVVSADLMCVL